MRKLCTSQMNEEKLLVLTLIMDIVIHYNYYNILPKNLLLRVLCRGVYYPWWFTTIHLYKEMLRKYYILHYIFDNSQS